MKVIGLTGPSGAGKSSLAKAVAKKMISLGAPADRVSTNYVGDTEQPFAENDMNRAIICTVK